MRSEPAGPRERDPGENRRGAARKGPAGPLPEGYSRYAGLGIQFAATVLVLGALGFWADRSLGTAPWLMIAGILLGSVGGFISLVRQVPAGRPRPPRTDRSQSR